MDEEQQTAPIIALLNRFNRCSEELFLALADQLPALLDELSADLSPWSGAWSKDFKLFEDELDKAHEFLLLAYREDLALFDQTHNNFYLTLNTCNSDEDILKKERVLNLLLRKAERSFVSLFTHEELVFEHLNKAFTGLKTQALVALYQLDGRMNEMAGLLKTAHRPILVAMESIQKQDIMRQSINHAIMSMDEYGKDDLGDSLENVTFKIDLLELSITVVNEVKDMLSGVKESFKEQTALIQQQLDMMSDQKEQLAKELYSLSFDQSPKFYLEEAVAVIKHSDLFYTRYLSLRTKIIKAHRLVLMQAQGFIDEAKEDEERLIKMDVIKQVIDAETPAIYDATDDALERTKEYYHVRDFLLNSADRMIANYDSIREIIAQEHVYTGKVTLYLDDIIEHTDKIDEIIAMLDESKAQMIILCKNLINEKSLLLKERGLDSWSLQSGKIGELTSHFTILSHKKAAGEIVGFDVEEGIDDGEFVLF